MSENSKKTLIAIVVSVGIIALVYLLLTLYKKNNDTLDDSHLKNYKVNEYIPAYVTDEAMARIYLNDFINIMYTDIEKAYNLLDSDYRAKKFGNINNFKNYVSNLRISSYNMGKYYKKNDREGHVVYGVYDENENLFIFKTKGVLQYSVFLDDYTMEIW